MEGEMDERGYELDDRERELDVREEELDERESEVEEREATTTLTTAPLSHVPHNSQPAGDQTVRRLTVRS